MGKLLPPKWGINLPFNYAIGEEIITPEYDPFNQDIKLKQLLNETTEVNRSRKVFAPDFNTDPPSAGEEIESMSTADSQETSTKAFEKMNASVFADATFGFARIGPSVGIRYYLNFEKDFNYWQFYAIWKF